VARIAVADRLPLFRAGVAAVLSEGGHSVEGPADLLAWVRGGQSSIVLLTLESDPDWSMLAEIAAVPTLIIIALLVDETPATGARAVHAGAQSVLPRSVLAGDLRSAVDAAVARMAVLPVDVVRLLRMPAPVAGTEASQLTSEQLHWLRELAAGVTVSDLAIRAGYSERAMYRMLQAVYARLGVRGRTQALIRAQALGWLGGPG
jgi:DNA-binding NarL/FixJ family response regulator